jgi:allantoinase
MRWNWRPRRSSRCCARVTRSRRIPQDNILAYLERDEEQAVIARCIAVFRRLTGAPPKGWLSPVLASSAHTEELLTAAGFRWYGDYNHIDLPFCVERGNGTIVAFPHTDYADHRVLRGNPRDWYDVYKDTFDYLYQNEPTAFLNLTVHCHFGGRPLMAAMFDRILKYFAGFPDVWMVRHDHLAEWVLDHRIAEWTNRERFYPG